MAKSSTCCPYTVRILSAIALFLRTHRFGSCFQRPFKGCFTHASGEHQPILKRCTGDRQRTDISFGVGFRRIHQCQVEGLSGSEFESRRFLELECQCNVGDFKCAQQLRFIAKWNGLGGQSDLLNCSFLSSALLPKRSYS